MDDSKCDISSYSYKIGSLYCLEDFATDPLVSQISSVYSLEVVNKA